jgi:hypothetical protein
VDTRNQVYKVQATAQELFADAVGARRGGGFVEGASDPTLQKLRVAGE